MVSYTAITPFCGGAVTTFWLLLRLFDSHSKPYLQRSVTDSSQRETKFKHSTDLDRRSLFVKNVDYSASEEEVRALFAQVSGCVAFMCLWVSRDSLFEFSIPLVPSVFQYGAVRDLRTVTKFDGKKRDFYYIDVSFRASVSVL